MLRISLRVFLAASALACLAGAAAPTAAVAATARVVVGLGESFQASGMTRPLPFAGDGGLASQARISRPTTVAADRKGGFYFTDSGNNRVRYVSRAGRITTVAGSGAANAAPACATGVPALQACLGIPHGIAVDTDGTLIITDTFNNRIDRLGRDGILRPIAGSGRVCQRDRSTCGEGGDPLWADLFWPTVARPTSKGLVISDSANRILLVRNNRITRIAGTGQAGFSGDNGPAVSAKIWAPADVIPYQGGWLISDGNNCRIRRVDSRGIIRPFAGYGGDLQACWASYANVQTPASGTVGTGWGGPLAGPVGDGGPAVQSRLTVTGFFAARGSKVYFTDFLNSRVRVVMGGRIYTALGTGQAPGVNGDGPLPATQFRLGWPSGVALRPDGRLLVTDPGNNRIVELSAR